MKTEKRAPAAIAMAAYNERGPFIDPVSPHIAPFPLLTLRCHQSPCCSMKATSSARLHTRTHQ